MISRRPDATFPDVADLASGRRGRERVLGHGDMDGGLWWASQAQGLIDSVDSVADVVSGVMAEAERLMAELPRHLA